MEDLAARLAAALPDRPRWLDTVGLLRSGRCRLVLPSGTARGRLPNDYIAVATWVPVASVVGRPPPRTIRRVAEGFVGEADVLAQPDDARHVAESLPDWRREPAVLHTLPRGAERALLARGPAPGTRLLGPADRSLLAGFPDASRRELEAVLAWAVMAARVVDGRPACVCYATLESGAWWDVSVETLEPFRGRGFAGECFRTVAVAMAERGKRAVWGAHESNAASLRVAAKLGFEPTDELITFQPPSPERVRSG